MDPYLFKLWFYGQIRLDHYCHAEPMLRRVRDKDAIELECRHCRTRSGHANHLEEAIKFWQDHDRIAAAT